MNIRTLQVVIADDHKEISDEVGKMVQRSLSELGCTTSIKVCSSASEVIDACSEKAIDVLISDHHFEHGVSGSEVLSQMADPFSRLYCILISGREESELLPVVRELQAQDESRKFSFLRKPVSGVEIHARMIDCIRFLDRLPLPFAMSYAQQRYQNESRPLQRLLLLRDYVEVGARLSAYAMLADVCRVGGQVTLEGYRVVSQVSLGSVIALLQSLQTLENCGTGELILKDLAKTVDRRFIKLLVGINSGVRNPEIGHPAALQEHGYYEQLLVKHKARIEELNGKFRVLTKYPLIVCMGVMNVCPGQKSNCTVNVLMGSVPFKNFELAITGPVQIGRVYAFCGSGNVVDLFPYVRYEYCSVCERKMPFLLHGTASQGRGGRYVSICAHPFEDLDAAVDMIVGQRGELL